jgi:hypothetical protein
MPKQHADELIAQDLAASIEETAQAVALASREGPAVFNAARLPEAANLALRAERWQDLALAVEDAVDLGELGIARVVKALGGAAFLASRPGLEATFRAAFDQMKPSQRLGGGG